MQDEKAMAITFWRPSRWERSVFDKEEAGPVDPDRFLENAYTWEPKESIWNSVEGDVAGQLERLLLDGFSPDKEPDDRKIEDFRNILEQIRELVTVDKSKWSDCEQYESVGDAKVNLRANLLLSFLHHLTWLCGVFTDMPGISITVR